MINHHDPCIFNGHERSWTKFIQAARKRRFIRAFRLPWEAAAMNIHRDGSPGTTCRFPGTIYMPYKNTYIYRYIYTCIIYIYIFIYSIYIYSSIFPSSFAVISSQLILPRRILVFPAGTSSAGGSSAPGPGFRVSVV